MEHVYEMGTVCPHKNERVDVGSFTCCMCESCVDYQITKHRKAGAHVGIVYCCFQNKPKDIELTLF